MRLLLLALLGLAAWTLFRWLHPRPEFVPLKTDPDDPLLLEAVKRAREGLPRFKELLSQPRDHALVKLRFVSSSDQVEHVWAEVIEVLGPDELGVRLVTPPVTHEGRLDSLHRCSFDDVEDWQVRTPDGRPHGGFTQRAMFAIARRDGVALPKRLAEQEREYEDA